MRSANSAGALGPALLADAGIGRHEGGVEGAFGEDGAEMIGQAEGDEKGVGRRPGAEDRGQHDVADKAGDPRQQRQPADREDAINHPMNLPSADAKTEEVEWTWTMGNDSDSQQLNCLKTIPALNIEPGPDLP